MKLRRTSNTRRKAEGAKPQKKTLGSMTRETMTRKASISAKKRAMADVIEDVNSDKAREQQQKSSNQFKGPNNGGSEAFVQFFYTNDKFLNQFEDDDIIREFQIKFPLFLASGISDSQLKKEISTIIEEHDFLEELMKKYDMNIQDFFRLIFRREGSIFKGPFIKKMKRLLDKAGF